MRDFSVEIQSSLDLLYKVENQASKKKLLLGKDKNIFLQVVLFKVPFISRPKRRFLKLSHSLYGESPEVCLFVPNRKTEVKYKKSTDELIDFCVEYYTDLLEKHKVKLITTVMPVKQLRSEYGTYELRRKLVNRFDLFLCKNSLLYNPRFLTALGKIFNKANKDPLGVSFPKSDADYDPEFEKNIRRAIFASFFYIKPFSDNYAIPVGNLSHTRAELQENLEAVINQILTQNIIPGGFRNIRSIYLWPSQSKPIPLYFSTDPVDPPRPRIKSRRKGLKSVEGEVSTQPGKKVHVMRNGEVFVSQINNNTEQENNVESEDSFDDGSDEEENDEENIKIKNQENDEDSSESEDDEKIEEKEQKLLIAKRKIEEDSYSFNGKVRRVMKEENEDEFDTEKEKKSRRKLKTKLNLPNSKNNNNKPAKNSPIKQKTIGLDKKHKIKAKKEKNANSSKKKIFNKN